MKNLISSLVFILVFIVLSPICSSISNKSPIGRWETIDDKTGRKKAIVVVTDVNGKLQGNIEKVFYYPDEEKRVVCEKCKGIRKGKPLVGLNILWDMLPDEDEWSDGKILDPKNGKIYRCKMHLENDGNILIVRGFIGISLLGRSQKWIRMESSDQ